MSGLTHDSASPQDIILHAVSRQLEISFDDGARFRLPAEYLRVYSPSAEVRGHGVGNEVLQTGKLHVAITGLEPVGHYALKIVFDAGHDSGLYSWAYLYELGVKHDQYWQDYLNRLAAAGASRE
ncbi:MAG: gamma-butyrobetaine hydroxylase-like domain-containing protein [Vogesella sp.]|uniref:gamma-butyrobetaine hydroxylase-like domain-containing protein n=1 Tax=Vogesella sp. TaxID=1904252 RepID=UPI003F3C7A2E